MGNRTALSTGDVGGVRHLYGSATARFPGSGPVGSVGSDRCFEKPEGCLTDEFVCSFNQPSFIGDTTVDLDADGDELTVGDELTDHQTAVLHAAAELTFGRSFQGEVLRSNHQRRRLRSRIVHGKGVLPFPAGVA